MSSEPAEVDWSLPSGKINRFQQASIARLVERCKHAHYVDIVVRINGKDEVYQADWIKHLAPETVTPAPTSDNCEHGLPRRFCTALHAETAEAGK